MHQITVEQFKVAGELDPAWASHLTEPVEIIGFCNMERSKNQPPVVIAPLRRQESRYVE